MKKVLKAIDLIGDLGQQMILVNGHPRIFKNVFLAMEHFKDIASWYNKVKLKERIKRKFTELRKELLGNKGYPQKKELLNKIDKNLQR